MSVPNDLQKHSNFMACKSVQDAVVVAKKLFLLCKRRAIEGRLIL